MRPDNADTLILGIPLVLVNTGALPVIVHNLRLVLPDLGGEAAPFILQATAKELGFKAEYTLAVQFAVRSREATAIISEFFRTPANATLRPKPYAVQLEDLIDDEPNWQKLRAFELRVPSPSVLDANTRGIHLIDNEVITHRMLQASAAQ